MNLLLVLVQMMIDNSPALLIAVPMMGAFLTPLISKAGDRIRNAWVLVVLSLAEFLAATLLARVLLIQARVYPLGAQSILQAAPAGFPVRIFLFADQFSALVTLLAVSVSLIASIYSFRFMQGHSGLEKFYTLLLLLAAGMVGLALTGDLFTMFVFVEITSISAAGLIAFSGSGESFEAGFKYMVISATGALTLLLGIGILYGKYGMLNMSAMGRQIWMQWAFVDLAALSVLVCALLMKIGSAPVHFWKPDVYQQAPAHVIAMLLTSSLVFMYVLMRICFSLFGLVMTPAMGWMIAMLGAASIMVGVLMAMPQRNLRRLLGYAAVAEIGYIMLGAGAAMIGLPYLNPLSIQALQGAVFHLINDALDLGLMLMVMGSVIYVTRKQDTSGVSGLAHQSVTLTVLFIVAMLAIAGMPPMGGFASKLLIYESLYYFNPLLAILGILGSVMLLAIFVKVFATIFLGPPYKGRTRPLPRSMMFAMIVFAVCILLLGLFPSLALDFIISPATMALAYPWAYVGGFL